MEMKLKAMIVDDEPKSVRLLQGYLMEFSNVEVVASAYSASDAYTLINLHNPHVVFLDILMPGENAFDLLNRFQTRNFEVIFTTAYDEYALKAFEKHALQYLLKPISQQKLASAVERCRHFFSLPKEAPVQAEADKPETKKISVSTVNGHVLLNTEDILRCEGDGNYTTIFTRDSKKFMISQNIKVIEEKLSGHSFFRVHKRHLINLSLVDGFSRGKGGYLTMESGVKVPISFRKKSEFLQLMQSGFH